MNKNDVLTHEMMVEIYEDMQPSRGGTQTKFDKLSKVQKRQFLNFCYGEDFMNSKDKGSLKRYMS